MSMARVYLCTGNCEVRYMNIALENLLYEMRMKGKNPFLININSQPFTSKPIKTKQREESIPYFEYYTGAEIPSIQYSTLISLITESRKRKLLVASGESFSDIIIYGASLPEENIYELSDELLLLIKKDVSSLSWVYNIAKRISEKKLDRQIQIVLIDPKSLEESATFFYNLRNELYSLSGQNIKISFDGFLNIDPDYITAAINSGKTLIEFVSGGQFHGLVTYILRNMDRNSAEVKREKSFFTRITTLAEKKQ